MTTIPLGTKAESLDRLSAVVTRATVLPLHAVRLSDWQADPAGELEALMAQSWTRRPLIVRSSAAAEDTSSESLAGQFLTLTSVRGRDAVAAAIEDVFASYDEPGPADQVLVQPELRGARLSGVACSCHPSTGAPYHVVSWVESADTEAVTSGTGAGLRTWFGARYSSRTRPPSSAPVAAVLALISELRTLTALEALDVEFAVSAEDELVLLQVRPLVVGAPSVSDRRHALELERVEAALAEREPSPYGTRTVYGVMPDWNPAEMIGLHPRPLALSLYRALITDRTWARSRERYGYKDLRGTPLLVDLGGLPYIDVRASAASMVPAEIGDDVAVRIVDRAVDTLAARPHLHDKIESEVLVTAHGFRTGERIERLVGDALDEDERTRLQASLRRLTDRLVTDRLVHADLERLHRLDEDGRAVVDGPSLRARLEHCVEYGTLPFAGLARAAFVATEMIEDLVALGVFTPQDRAAFVAGLGLVSGELRRDLDALDRDAFLERYGHLRPGTYDILSPRYDEAPDAYFDWSLPGGAAPAPPALRPSADQLARIDELIGHVGLSCDARELLDFVGTAIRGREQAKFAFTRLLSDTLKEIRDLGARLGFSADQMSYVDVDTLCSLTGDPEHDLEALALASARGEDAHRAGQAIALPPVIRGRQDVWGFLSQDIRPNFVTRERVVARVADIDAGDDPRGAIAFIPSADPGYDWLFARGVAGLVTAFGGVNSHMALRALELGVPAVIGAGPSQFRSWARAERLEIDGAGERVVELT